MLNPEDLVNLNHNLNLYSTINRNQRNHKQNKLTWKCVCTTTALKTIEASWTLVSSGLSANFGHCPSQTIVWHKNIMTNQLKLPAGHSPDAIFPIQFTEITYFSLFISLRSSSFAFSFDVFYSFYTSEIRKVIGYISCSAGRGGQNVWLCVFVWFRFEWVVYIIFLCFVTR